MDGETVVFIEVRTRSTTGTFGTAQESVDARKRRKVRAVAQSYLLRHGLADARVRFDVIAVQLQPDGAVSELTHIEAAF